MSGASMEEFRADKRRLQDSLLDLLAQFESRWGCSCIRGSSCENLPAKLRISEYSWYNS